MEGNIFKSISVMCNAYSSQFGVEVKLVNGRACTDGKVIYLPKPKPEFMDLTWGYACHESAHCKYSDFEYTEQKLSTSIDKIHLKAFSNLLNLLEDSRIEILIMKEFPGTTRYFDAMNLKLLAISDDADISTLDNQSQLRLWIESYVTGCVTRSAGVWNDKAIELEKILVRGLGEDAIEQVKGYLDEIPFCQDTEEVFYLTKELYQYLMTLYPQDTPVNASNTSQDGSSESDGDDLQDGSSESDGDDLQDGSSESDGDDLQDGSSESDGDDLQDGSSESDGDDLQDGSSESDGDDLPSSKYLVSVLSEMNSNVGQLLEDILSDPEATEPLSEVELQNENEGIIAPTVVNDHVIDDFTESANQSTMAIRQTMLRILEAKTSFQRNIARRGRISTRHINRLKLGDDRIYIQKQQSIKELNCDVVLLADTSYSMGEDIKAVKMAIFAFLAALENVSGVNTAAYAFGFYGGSAENPIHVGCLKSPGEAFSPEITARIASLDYNGTTPAVQAYWASITAHNAMFGHKKVIIMVTDGLPDDVESTKEIVSSLRKAGIKIICLGVGVVDLCKPYFDKVYGENGWIEVADFSTLPSDLCNIATDLI